MIVFDVIIYNMDRYFGNFDFFIDNKINKIIDTVPHFDNENSLFNFKFARSDKYSRNEKQIKLIESVIR